MLYFSLTNLPSACSPFVLRSLLGSGCDPSSSIQPLSVKSRTPSAYGRHKVSSKKSRSSWGCRTLTVSIYQDLSEIRCSKFETGENYLISKVLVESSEYVQEQSIESVHNFMIVVVDLHLQVQTGVFSEMSVCVRVLCAEDRSDFVHPSHITRDAHLFSKLRTLDAACERLE